MSAIVSGSLLLVDRSSNVLTGKYALPLAIGEVVIRRTGSLFFELDDNNSVDTLILTIMATIAQNARTDNTRKQSTIDIEEIN